MGCQHSMKKTNQHQWRQLPKFSSTNQSKPSIATSTAQTSEIGSCARESLSILQQCGICPNLGHVWVSTPTQGRSPTGLRISREADHYPSNGGGQKVCPTLMRRSTWSRHELIQRSMHYSQNKGTRRPWTITIQDSRQTWSSWTHMGNPLHFTTLMEKKNPQLNVENMSVAEYRELVAQTDKSLQAYLFILNCNAHK
jgi:hypothetical protein